VSKEEEFAGVPDAELQKVEIEAPQHVPPSPKTTSDSAGAPAKDESKVISVEVTKVSKIEATSIETPRKIEVTQIKPARRGWFGSLFDDLLSAFDDLTDFIDAPEPAPTHKSARDDDEVYQKVKEMMIAKRKAAAAAASGACPGTTDGATDGATDGPSKPPVHIAVAPSTVSTCATTSPSKTPVHIELASTSTTRVTRV